MGVPRSPLAEHPSLQEFYVDRAQDLSRHVAHVLSEATGSTSARVAAADALQEGMLRVHREWPLLEGQSESERDRRVYHSLRLAALDLVRKEYGRGEERRDVYAVDFQTLENDLDADDPRDREFAVAVLGRMASRAGDDPVEYGTLLAGLASLSEREAVIFTAVERLGWEQGALADRLGMEPARLYEALFTARKLFYTFIRHAHGIELDDEERARLHAYQDGLLSRREQRLTRRHLRHCERCQAYTRASRVFANDSHRVLAGLPFVLGVEVLAKKQVVKSLGMSAGSGAGTGLLAQPGAAKALAITVGLLGAGTGVGAWLSIGHTPPTDPPLVGTPRVAKTATVGAKPKHVSPASPTRTTSQSTTTKKKAARKKSSAKPSASRKKRESQSGTATVNSSPPAPSAAAPVSSSPPDTSGTADPSGGSGGSGGSQSDTGGGEFFGG